MPDSSVHARQNTATPSRWRKEEPTRIRIERQRRALSSILNADDFLAARLPQALKHLCQTTSLALDVARVSVWQWGFNKQYLECLVQYNQGQFENKDQKLEISKFPVYFEALERDGRIEAHDVRRHPAVSQLLDFYLIPFGITSMLDAAFLVDGHLAGVICCEHTGIRRHWTSDELAFASTIAMLAGLLFAQNARNLAETEAVRMQMYYRQLVELSHDVIFTLNTKGQITFASPQWHKQLGYDVEREVLNRHFAEFLHEQDIHNTMQKWQQALHGEAIRNYEYRVRHANGSWRRYSANANPIRNTDGTIHSFICNARDITEKHFENQLQIEKKRFESIGRLAGGIAHEFNNMLGVILGHLELLETEPEEPAKQQEHLAEIRKAISRSSRLTFQLLAYAQKQTGSPRLLDLHIEIDHIIHSLQRLCGPNLHIHWQPGSINALVHFDSRWLQEILTGLCLRAKDAMNHDHGQIEIRTCFESVHPTTYDLSEETLQEYLPPGDYVRIDIADNGTAISEKQLPHLFDPFSPETPLTADMGMRLAGVYGFVRQGGGYIFHKRESHTTLFSIYLPARKPVVSNKEILHGELSHHETNQPCVLVVDDEPTIARMIQMILARYDIHVITASGSQEALTLVEQYHKHLRLLISDIAMPQLNGFLLANAVRARIPNIHVLYMSGYPWDLIRGNHTLADGDGFLQKPFTVENLLADVQSRL